MFVNTFYSFKGGVGRTMALANVAVHLAQRGRRILVVDFDLEAPGLDTFPALRPNHAPRGLVDYVAQYLDTDQAPDVREFVGESPEVDNVLVMPSGAMEGRYAASLGQIDWGGLYAEREGYLLFEDLKEQWREAFAPDYVLVDSRTGFTDTGGICTRQLPDAVTVLFFPNEQNLRGLAKVVGDVRSEAEPPRRKTIKLDFVMSNVPDLDDEDDILIKMKEGFQRELAFDDEPLIIHRYDSLSLLNQSVFALERPRSRLAREYERLADRTVRGNLADPDGAKQFLRERRRGIEPFHHTSGESSDLSETIKRLEALHREDGEVLFRLGQLARRRAMTNAESLLDKAIEAGYGTPECYLERARARAAAGDDDRASEDALSVLGFDDLRDDVVMEATLFLSPEDAADIGTSRAIASLASDDQTHIADILWREGHRGASDDILRRIGGDLDLPDEDRRRACSELSLHCIASGRFGEAIDVLERQGRHIDEMGIQDAFNYGMAVWGASGKVSEATFEKVLALHTTGNDREGDANYSQCLAVAHWAVGDPVTAVRFAKQACNEAESEGRIFSCWQYALVRRDEFLEDTTEILAMIDGDQASRPKFLLGNSVDESVLDP